MSLKGQLLELRNRGKYQFYLRVGIYDDALTDSPEPFPKDEGEGLPIGGELAVYECRLDFSNAERPVSYPIGKLAECMDVYEKYESPNGLSQDLEHFWKVGFIIDTIITEACATDLLEVIHGEDYQQEQEETDALPPREIPYVLPRSVEKRSAGKAFKLCPDCGAEAHKIHATVKGKESIFVCEVCGRHFTPS